MAKPRLVKVRALFVFLQIVSYEKRMPRFETPSCVMYFRGDYRPDWVIFSRRRLLKSDALMSSSIVICIRYFQ